MQIDFIPKPSPTFDHTENFLFKLTTSGVTTGNCDVHITEAFEGPMFISEDGEKLAVSMKDNGFEICYIIEGVEQWWSFNDGVVTFHGNETLNESSTITETLSNEPWHFSAGIKNDVDAETTTHGNVGDHSHNYSTHPRCRTCAHYKSHKFLENNRCEFQHVHALIPWPDDFYCSSHTEIPLPSRVDVNTLVNRLEK